MLSGSFNTSAPSFLFRCLPGTRFHSGSAPGLDSVPPSKESLPTAPLCPCPPRPELGYLHSSLTHTAPAKHLFPTTRQLLSLSASAQTLGFSKANAFVHHFLSTAQCLARRRYEFKERINIFLPASTHAYMRAHTHASSKRPFSTDVNPPNPMRHWYRFAEKSI